MALLAPATIRPALIFALLASAAAELAAQTLPADLVLHAADATEVHGTWTRTDDPSAASGARLWHPNAGAAKISTASSAPRDYFELTFRAEAGLAYRLWIRGRAENDSYFNDSVFVQFSGSVNASGTPVYRIGSTEATAVIVENCSGCGLQGWGWQDNEYGGLAPGPAIYFAETGPQKIRVQGREDGISIDQIVLSSGAYFSTAPGAVRNDNTILRETDFSGSPAPAARMLAFTTASHTDMLGHVAAVRDIDGDGRPDVAGIFDNAPIELFSAWNSGGRSFANAHYEELWGGPEMVLSFELADVTRDGKPDVVFHDRSYQQLAVRPGVGDGTFAGGVPLMDFAEVVGDFVLADFNRDGTPDLVTTEPLRNAAVTYLGNGNGTFTFLAWVPSGPSPTSIATGDFNGDGKADIATLSVEQQSVYFSIGDGTGRFPRQASVLTGALPRALAVRDLNRDGFDDIVIANGGTTVTVNMATSAGSFAPAREFVSSRIPGMRVRQDGLAIADINGDAHPDLLVQHFSGNDGFVVSTAVLPGVGDGTFAEPDEFAASFSGPVLTADFDGDGRQDVFLPDGNRGFSLMWNDPVDANRPPVAKAGADASVPYSQQGSFRLNGSTSSDPDSHALTYSWVDDSGAQFSTGPGPKPFTTARQPGTYTFTLTVDDLHGGRSSDSVTVTITDDGGAAGNRAPTVDASASLNGQWPYELQFRDEQQPPTYLYHDASDPDGDPLTFEWRDGSGRVVTMPLPKLAPGTHQFSVTVRDGRGGEASDTVLVTVLPFEEIVITAGYKEQAFGNWERLAVPASEGAASDAVVHDRNLGAPKASAPGANPASYAEFTFPADPTLEYKLWVRLKADDNFWGNDSVFLQFSGATDAAGNAVFKTGTTSGLAVNLEECSGCGVSGWGWRDDAWGARGVVSSTLLRFPGGGLQTIRVQTREDGVSIDQIVLSAVKYKTTRPGTTKDDATKLQMTAAYGR